MIPWSKRRKKRSDSTCIRRARKKLYVIHVPIIGNDNNRNSKNRGFDVCSMPLLGDQHSEVPSLNSGRDTRFSDFLLFLHAVKLQNCDIVNYDM